MQEPRLPTIDGQLPPGLDGNPRGGVSAPVIGIGRHPLRRVVGALGLVYGGRNRGQAVKVVGKGPPTARTPGMSTRVPCFLQGHHMVNVQTGGRAFHPGIVISRVPDTGDDPAPRAATQMETGMGIPQKNLPAGITSVRVLVRPMNEQVPVVPGPSFAGNDQTIEKIDHPNPVPSTAFGVEEGRKGARRRIIAAIRAGSAA